jgi:Lipocalin-like domain
MRAVSFVILLFLSSSALADDGEKLLGNWKLVSLFTEDVQTKQRNTILGEHPSGFIGFTPERFFAVLMAEGRKAPQTPEEQAAAYRTVVAYTGKWRLEGEKFVTKVDVAWNPGWVGTDQIRFWRVDGNKLFITSAPTTMPGPDGTEKTMIANVVWEREQ